MSSLELLIYLGSVCLALKTRAGFSVDFILSFKNIRGISDPDN